MKPSYLTSISTHSSFLDNCPFPKPSLSKTSYCTRGFFWRLQCWRVPPETRLTSAAKSPPESIWKQQSTWILVHMFQNLTLCLLSLSLLGLDWPNLNKRTKVVSLDPCTYVPKLNPVSPLSVSAWSWLTKFERENESNPKIPLTWITYVDLRS